MKFRHGRVFVTVCFALLFVFSGTASQAEDRLSLLRARVATGQYITPLAAPGSRVEPLHTDMRNDEDANAANAVSTALSPDGATLLILTSGFNYGFSKEDGTPIV